MSNQNATFSPLRATRHAFFLASSLEALYEALPEDEKGADVSTKFLVGSLAVMAQQLGLALQNEDTSHLLPGSIQEASDEY